MAEASRHHSADDAISAPVNVLDQSAVKRSLDDALVKLVELAGYRIDYRLSNVRLALMIVACLVALYCQFGIGEFPTHKNSQMVLVFVYGGLSIAAQFIYFFFEKDIVAKTYSNEEMSSSSGLQIESSMDKGDEMITVKCKFRKKLYAGIVETFSRTVGEYFSKDGELDEEKFQKDLLRAIFRLEGNAPKKQK